jgi:hypothetical protein
MAVNRGLGCKNIWSLAVNGDDDLFAGTAGCGTGVYRSLDSGDHWTLVNTGLTSTDVAALAVAGNGSLFAGTYSQFGIGGGVFRSVDNGETWTEQNDGFTAVDVNAIAINSAGDLFATALGGAFRSADEGETWTDISGGLVPTGGNTWTVAFDPSGYAFAGTEGGGAFRSLQSTAAPCPQSRRYWYTNPTLWPVETLVLGTQSYTKDELLGILFTGERDGDASTALAAQLIAAKLNLSSGADPGPVSSTIDDADTLLSGFSGKLPYRVKRSSPAGQAMEADVDILRPYNWGNLTLGCGR